MSSVNITNYLHKRHPATPKYRQYLISRGVPKANLDRHSFLRHDRIVKRFLPPLIDQVGLEKLKTMTLVEVGGGTGCATLAFAPVFKEAHAFDLHANSVEVAKERKRLYEIENAFFYLDTPEASMDRALSLAADGAVFLLYAVLEHMLEAERADCLERIWRNMKPGSYLIIGETPNRFLYYDEHTYLQPFVHMLPDLTCYRYLTNHKEIRMADQVTSCSADVGEINLMRSRRGLGLSYHDFEVAFDGFDLNECVVRNFCEITLFNELYLLSVLHRNEIQVPVAFATKFFHFLAKKPADEGEARRIREANQRDFARTAGFAASMFSKFLDGNAGPTDLLSEQCMAELRTARTGDR